MSEKGVPTLDEFVAGASTAWWKTLPQDVQDQIMSSDAGSAVIAKWLTAIGIADVTRSKVETLVLARNALREESR